MTPCHTAYRHNHYRFLLVSRQVPYIPVSAASAYRSKIEEELMDASTALTAAVKLEALGGDLPAEPSASGSREARRPWVRFAAAEALAYIGQTDGVGELARLAEDHPALLGEVPEGPGGHRRRRRDRPPRRHARRVPTPEPAAGGTLHRAAAGRRPAPGAQRHSDGQVVLAAPARAGRAGGGPSRQHRAQRDRPVRGREAVPRAGPCPSPVGEDFTVAWPAGQPTVRVTRIVKGRGEFRGGRRDLPWPPSEPRRC